MSSYIEIDRVIPIKDEKYYREKFVAWLEKKKGMVVNHSLIEEFKCAR